MLALAAPTIEQGYDAYERGDVVAAVEIWRTLAEAGDATAQLNLVQLYRLGQGVEANDEEAIKWYSLAARLGSEMARYNLLLIRDEGRASHEDLSWAFAGAVANENSNEEPAPEESAVATKAAGNQ